ncbi:MAG: sodium:proton antiporter [Bacteroidales bacterium]|nr:sodium:proton antiporter [Bacteroidales bacterium]
MEKVDNRKNPSWVVSLIPLVFLILLLFFVIKFFGTEALSGGSQVALLLSAGLTIFISTVFYKVPWDDFENAMKSNIKTVCISLIILLLIGAIAGSWMVSGVVPTMIYYGMKIISPKIFLFAACILCALISLMTGSSWTTIATIGVALIGIGIAEGFSPGWIAGAIISGAYFGDKISPLSDTTILASSSTETPLFTHIRYMMITTVPSITIALIIFLTVSILHETNDVVQVDVFSSALANTFNISPWLLLVPVLTAIMIILKMPALPTLFIASLLAGIFALIFQPDIVWQIANGGGDGFTSLTFRDGFKGLMQTYYGSTNIDTGSAQVNELVSTTGMNGMLNTVFLIMCAMVFGASMMGSGMIRSLTDQLIKIVRNRTGLVASTVTTGIISNITTSDQYLSIIITSSLFKDLYKEKGYESRLLSRSAEDSATVTSVLIPWNTCGMTQATVLRVPTMVYFPYCFFNLISPLMSIFIAAIGFKIRRNVKAVTDEESGNQSTKNI